jgi:hypothetical protein
MSRPPLIERRRTPPSLVLYVAVSIAAGFGLLGWATVTQPIVATIASAGLPRIAGGASGRVFSSGSVSVSWVPFARLRSDAAPS